MQGQTHLATAHGASEGVQQGHLWEVHCASSAAGGDVLDEGIGNLPPNRCLRLLCGASYVRREDDIRNPLQLCRECSHSEHV